MQTGLGSVCMSVPNRFHFHQDVRTIDHPAVQFLDYLRTNGALIRMQDDNWLSNLLQERAARGLHQSTKAHVDFVCDEMAEFNDKSFWTVLPLKAVQHLPNLRLSPLGCVPKSDRRPRLINDLTFYEINKQIIRLAPSKAMQFGKELERDLNKIQSADPQHGPVYLCKIDMADGFYQVDLEAERLPHSQSFSPTKRPNNHWSPTLCRYRQDGSNPLLTYALHPKRLQTSQTATSTSGSSLTSWTR
jgi:hypothetical protein